MQRGEEPLRLLILDCTCITVKMQGFAILSADYSTLRLCYDLTSKIPQLLGRKLRNALLCARLSPAELCRLGTGLARPEGLAAAVSSAVHNRQRRTGETACVGR